MSSNEGGHIRFSKKKIVEKRKREVELKNKITSKVQKEEQKKPKKPSVLSTVSKSGKGKDENKPQINKEKKEETKKEPKIKVFVRNIPFSAKIEDVFGLLEKELGENVILDFSFPRFTDTGNSKGMCFFSVLGVQNAEKAFLLNEKLEIQDRKLIIKQDLGSVSEFTGNTSEILVTNLPSHPNLEKIQTEFKCCGKIVKCNFGKKSKVKSASIVYITFESPECVKKALKLNGVNLWEREIVVKEYLPKKNLKDNKDVKETKTN